MKKTLTLIILLIITIHRFNAQQVLSLNASKIDYPNGAYYKDLDGELNPYIGTWQGIWNGKTVIIELRKIKKRSSADDGTYYDLDKIVGNRKIIASNGTVEIDKITGFDENNTELSGIYGQFSNFSQKYLLFQPDNMCNKTANIDVTFINTQKTQMSLHYKYNPSGITESCQYYNQIIVQEQDWPFNFPKDIILTKQ